MKKNLFFLFVIILLSINFQLVSCHSGSSPKDSEVIETAEGSAMTDTYMEEEKAAAPQSKMKKSASDDGVAVDDAMPIKKVKKKDNSKIIKNADIKYQVEDYEKAYTQITDLVNQHEAYVSNENAVKNNYSLYNQIEIRVDAENFDNLVNDLMKLANYVDHKRISAEDVTDQFVDMQARLKAKTEVEARLKSILQKARTIQEILEVEKEIKYVREEIETIEGRLKYLSDRVSYSTIKLHVYQNVDYQQAPEKGFGHKFVKAIKAGWDGLQVFIIGIFYLWPLWLIIGGVIWLVLRLVRGKKKKK